MDTGHDQLFRQYAAELEEAKLLAETWWRRLVETEARKLGGRTDAMASVKRRWPLGPAAHPRVIAILRKYWLACEALNRELESLGDDRADADQVVSAPVFLCEFLLDANHEKLAAFIAPLNYWPIGRVDDAPGR